MTAQFAGNRAGRHALSSQLLDPLSINASPAPVVDAIGLCLRNACALSLPANVVLELRHCAQDREGQLSRAAAGVDGLMDALERDTLAAEFVEQLEQVGQRAGEAVKPADHDGVAIADKLEHFHQPGACPTGAAGLILKDAFAAVSREFVHLDIEALVRGADARIADDVTVRLLPRLMGLEARGELGIVDKVIEELVPGLGRETCLAKHVRQFFHAVIRQRGDGLVQTGVDADDGAVGEVVVV